MKENTKPEQVIVNRNGSKEIGVTTHMLYQDVQRGESIVRGPFLGTGVKLDSGHEVYAQPDQLTPATEAEAALVRDKQNAARESLEAARQTLWGGNGSRVYTAA